MTGRPRPNVRLLAAVFAVGAYAVIAQSVLVREVLVVSFGVELTWGIVFFGWLLGVAIGAAAGGRVLHVAHPPSGVNADVAQPPSAGDVSSSSQARAPVRHQPQPQPGAAAPHKQQRLFAFAASALPAVAIVAVCFVRASRGFFDVGPGEYLSLWTMLWIYPLLTLPVSVVVGFAFPIAASLAQQPSAPHPDPLPPEGGEGTTKGKNAKGVAAPIANVYAVEAFGSLVGGALFSFVLVERVPTLALLGYAGAVLIFAASLFATHYGRRGSDPPPESSEAGGGSEPRRPWHWKVILPALPPLAFAAATFLFAPAIERGSVERRWETFKTGTVMVPPSPIDSRYQNITLARRENEFTVFLDGLKAMNFPDPAALAADAHFVMCEAKSVKRVLLIGGGIEGPLAEMLKYPVERIDYVTLDPELVALVRPHLSDADRVALDDPRVVVHYEDGVRFLREARFPSRSATKYDLVWLNVPEPTSLLTERFYSNNFIKLARMSTEEDGLLALRLTASPGYFDDARRRYLASVLRNVESVGPCHWMATWGEQTFILASPSEGVFAADGAELARRYRERGVRSANFDPLWFEGATDMLTPANVAKIRGEIERGLREAQERADDNAFRPLPDRPYLYRLILDERARTGGSASVLEWLTRLKFRHAALAALAAALLWFAAARWMLKRPLRESATLFSVATTGFATMALSLILLVEFQDLFGYVYSFVGVLIGIFMLGLVLGSLFMKRRLRGEPALGASSLARHDLGFALFAILLTQGIGMILKVSYNTGGRYESPFMVLVLAVGFFGGLIFPLAAKIALDAGKATGRAAGSITAADNVGACLGALLTGVVLIPALGLFAACVLLALLKVISAVALFAAARTKA